MVLFANAQLQKNNWHGIIINTKHGDPSPTKKKKQYIGR